jgi:phenylalanyl-tRNA synthetase beta chain
MKLPLGWLRESVTIESDTEELCKRLTMGGLEVEGVEHLAPAFTDVFVAQVIGVERHPNADRLSLCEVDAGGVGRFRVVCGAPNVHREMKAAFARLGARLAQGVHGQSGGSLEDATPLQAATIRGVRSEGMLCSGLELGLSSDHEGIIELDREATPGMALASYLQLPDTVLDIAITPNRGDCLSIQGLAREIAALFATRLIPTRFVPAQAPGNSDQVSVEVTIDAPELCPRYAALAMTGIKLGASPYWMQRRLELCGMRPVNNIVDVTNYVMLEIGQPLHAFDLTRIAGRGIIVRRAERDREFETLDGVKRTLDPDDLMIADREKPLAIAGVMGGINSQVTAATAEILLESAYFEPMTIARTARRLGLRSEASYRFERGIDRAGQANALLRAAELIRSTGGREASLLIDCEPQPAPVRRFELSVDSIDSLLGVKVPRPEITRRLTAVGVSVEALGENRLSVSPPPFRPDLNQMADMAEEVTRLAGLAEIPATLPLRTASVGRRNSERSFNRKLRELMVGFGLVEVKTIAFVAPTDNQRFLGFFTGEGLTGKAEPVRVINPLSAELSEMRLSLLPGLLAALRFNLNREASAFHAFEIGKVFAIGNGVTGESQRVAGVSYGDYAMRSVEHAAVQANFFSVKGILEECFAALGMRSPAVFNRVDEELAPYFHPGCAACIVDNNRIIGLIGELHPAEALRLELSHPCMLFELDLQNLMSYSTEARQVVQPPPRFPAVRRDVALLVDRDCPADKVVREILSLNSPLLESVELFDVYEGGSVVAGKKSVALACRYRAKERTLTDEEVNRAHNRLVELAMTRLGAELRL